MKGNNYNLKTEKKPEEKIFQCKKNSLTKKDQRIYSTLATHLRSSEKEHKADALALGADEGRDKLR